MPGIHAVTGKSGVWRRQRSGTGALTLLGETMPDIMIEAAGKLSSLDCARDVRVASKVAGFVPVRVIDALG
jgi:hypothetical protein